MNFQRIYDEIINRARTRKILGYKERHHVIPRCMGGTDDKDNLVDLTAREHFIVHKLLVEIYPDNMKLFHAYWMMCNMKSNNQNRNYNIGNREYERLRIKFSETNSKIMKGHVVSEKTRQLISKSQTGEKNSMYNKNHTPESIQKIREAKIGEKNSFYGKTHTPETIQKLREINLGKIVSEKTRQKISEANKGKISPMKGIVKSKIACPHCSKQCDPGNAAKYHFNNCKFK
jgi:hypothetical protein